MRQTLTSERRDILRHLYQVLSPEKDQDACLHQLEETLEEGKIGILFPPEEGFPPLLRQIPDPPEVLFYAGHLEEAARPCVGIVGTRTPTPYGQRCAYDIAFSCASHQVTVVSGMARGIDSCAHRGALDGGGHTIAVMAGGLDTCYPASNEELFGKVRKSGLVLSETPPGIPARKWMFLHRNRLISGLSLGVAVVQAGERSGAVNTAQHAGDQGRDVLAVPGSLYEKMSVGTHRLIADGAQIITDVGLLSRLYEGTDMAAYEPSSFGIRLERKSSPEPLEEILPEDEAAIREKAGRYYFLYRLIGDFGSTSEELRQKSRLSPPQLQSALTMLEMKRLIVRGGPLIYRL